MTEREQLLESIASTTADYRKGEVPAPTSGHVDRWIMQFDQDAQMPLLRELDHVLTRTYFARGEVSQFFSNQIERDEIAGNPPRDYWRRAYFLDIQENGHSQVEIRKIFGEALKAQVSLEIEKCGADGGDYIYLDDVLFTGGRVGTDLSSWVADNAPAKGIVHVLVIAAHRLGEWKCKERLASAAESAGKDLCFRFWAALRVENRMKYRSRSEVLWPTELPDDAALKAYLAEEKKFPFEPRVPGGKLEHQIFSSEDGRQILERELLLAGMRIRSFSQNPSKALRPLGFSPFGLGFGSMIVTHRNCPNNCPLALWWGDPEASSSHPLSKWYPLFPRKTYEPEIDLDDFDF